MALRGCASGELGASKRRAIRAPKEPSIRKYRPSVSFTVRFESDERHNSVMSTPKKV